MWTWSLNWGEITPAIVIGSCPMTPSDLERIQTEAGTTAVLSIQHDDCHAYWEIDFPEMAAKGAQLGLSMARCPIRDFDIEDMRRHLPRAIALLAGLQACGHRTYVHCTAGLGRAPLTVLGYLTLVEGLDPEDAIQLILKGRPDAVPAWEAYYGCVEDLVAANQDRIERLAYELHEQGVPAGAEAHWSQAQARVLRDVLLETNRSGSRGRGH